MLGLKTGGLLAAAGAPRSTPSPSSFPKPIFIGGAELRSARPALAMIRRFNAPNSAVSATGGWCFPAATSLVLSIPPESARLFLPAQTFGRRTFGRNPRLALFDCLDHFVRAAWILERIDFGHIGQML
jgi:hypothetical protein